jgi:uncharacterized coiled-coil protein SlyX
MTAIEERVAFLEGRVNEQSQRIDGIREAVASLERRMDAGFEAIDRRFEAIDRRFEAIDRRFETIDRRFEAIDRRFEAIEQRFVSLDAKLDTRFLWLVGIQATTLVAIVAALVSR